jgi:hypothetical protein
MKYPEALAHATRNATQLNADMVVFTYENGDCGVSNLDNWVDPTRIGESKDYWQDCELVEIVEAPTASNTMTPETAINLLQHWLLDEPGYPQPIHWNGIRQAIATLEALDRREFAKYTDYHPGDLIAESKEILEIATERYSD